jgi:hypothetical protein
MYEAIKFKIRGVMPTIMHNGQTSDPLNGYAKDMKKLTSKKQKKDADHMDLAKLEWYAALYVDEQNRPCWPGENIEAMLVAAAKKNRMGPSAKSGLFIDGNSIVQHDGPRTADGLWKYKSFEKNPYVSRVPVVVNKSRVMRTRPIFQNWSLEFTVHYMPDIINKEDVIEFVNKAGKMIGLSDWRPKYGRFEIESVEEIKSENVM